MKMVKFKTGIVMLLVGIVILGMMAISVSAYNEATVHTNTLSGTTTCYKYWWQSGPQDTGLWICDESQKTGKVYSKAHSNDGQTSNDGTVQNPKVQNTNCWPFHYFKAKARANGNDYRFVFTGCACN